MILWLVGPSEFVALWSHLHIVLQLLRQLQLLQFSINFSFEIHFECSNCYFISVLIYILEMTLVTVARDSQSLISYYNKTKLIQIDIYSLQLDSWWENLLMFQRIVYKIVVLDLWFGNNVQTVQLSLRSCLCWNWKKSCYQEIKIKNECKLSPNRLGNLIKMVCFL